MATIVDKAPVKLHMRHDFSTLADGQTRRFVHGEDFASEPRSFYAAAHSYARRHDLEFFGSVRDDAVYLRLAPRGE